MRSSPASGIRPLIIAGSESIELELPSGVAKSHFPLFNYLFQVADVTAPNREVRFVPKADISILVLRNAGSMHA